MTDDLTRELGGAPASLVDRGVDPERGCWTWKGPMSVGSPILFAGHRARISVRRLVFELTNRPLRRSEPVGTTCGTHRCIRPEHLVVHNPAALSTEPGERGASVE